VQLLVSAGEQAAKFLVLIAAPVSAEVAERPKKSCWQYAKVHLTVVVVAVLTSCLVEALYVSAYARRGEASAAGARDARTHKDSSTTSHKRDVAEVELAGGSGTVEQRMS
jgi:NhaP-type Na+/H+ or K+/H+ antiporter